jgi:hypothetical protein
LHKLHLLHAKYGMELLDPPLFPPALTVKLMHKPVPTKTAIERSFSFLAGFCLEFVD